MRLNTSDERRRNKVILMTAERRNHQGGGVIKSEPFKEATARVITFYKSVFFFGDTNGKSRPEIDAVSGGGNYRPGRGRSAPRYAVII